MRTGSIHDPTGQGRTQHLGHDVHDGPEQADLTAGEHSQGDGWVEVGAADVTQTLGQRGDGQSEAQRHLHLLVRFGVVRIPDGRGNAEEDEQGHSHKLGQDGPPEVFALELPHRRWQCGGWSGCGCERKNARVFGCVCVFFFLKVCVCVVLAHNRHRLHI